MQPGISDLDRSMIMSAYSFHILQKWYLVILHEKHCNIEVIK